MTAIGFNRAFFFIC